MWQCEKPAGFRAMSCGKVKNPPGFALCRVAKSKTRRVSRHVEWQSPKPVGFHAMSSGKVQNPPGFALCRVTKSKTRRVLRHVVWRSLKLAGFLVHPCRGAKAYAPKMFLAKGLGLKSGGFWAYPYWENVKPAKFFIYPCRGAKAYAPKCPSPKVCA